MDSSNRTKDTSHKSDDDSGCGCLTVIAILFILFGLHGCVSNGISNISNHFSRYPMPSNTLSDYRNGEALRHIIYHNFQKNEPNITVKKITVSRSGDLHIYTNISTTNPNEIRHIWSRVYSTNSTVADYGTAYVYDNNNNQIISGDPCSSNTNYQS